MIVVSDATPISTLLKVDQATLLKKLFDTVIIPEAGADILLTDDRKARAAAASLNVSCTGLLGLLILAKQANHLESVTTMVEVLEKQGGLYLSPDVKVEAAKLAGEYQA